MSEKKDEKVTVKKEEIDDQQNCQQPTIPETPNQRRTRSQSRRERQDQTQSSTHNSTGNNNAHNRRSHEPVNNRSTRNRSHSRSRTFNYDSQSQAHDNEDIRENSIGDILDMILESRNLVGQINGEILISPEEDEFGFEEEGTSCHLNFQLLFSSQRPPM